MSGLKKIGGLTRFKDLVGELLCTLIGGEVGILQDFTDWLLAILQTRNWGLGLVAHTVHLPPRFMARFMRVAKTRESEGGPTVKKKNRFYPKF